MVRRVRLGKIDVVTWAPTSGARARQRQHRLTRINAGDDSIGLRPLDDEIFDYPWLYAVEVGRWELSDEDAAHLREYLLRGGFLMVDDFHGTVQWEGFMESMRRAARNLATSSKKLLWAFQKKLSRGAKSSTSSPAAIAAST